LKDSFMQSNAITFVIGGSYGLDESIKKRADLKMSFSKMTFPHGLFRVMLVEQIYRAMSINANMPYHK
ncbi:MAG: 23S rRNA (pseudouridine(1915)-N(3))-methyltransferase RlmH, partial [Clostridia bacterium]|nr:23S rRNA (pseudouridine(1915)-N(3))-methyltransferase RlmH [Clostridia bacterium]